MQGADLVARIWALCKERNVSKTTFYSDLGISPAAVSQWKHDVTAPSMKKLVQVADYLKTTPEYLLAGKKNIAAIPGDDIATTANELFPQLTPEHQKLVLDLIQNLVPPEGQS